LYNGGVMKVSMRPLLATAVFLASIAAAHAQRASQTPAAAMAARANQTSSQALDAANGTQGLYIPPSDTAPDSGTPQPILRGPANSQAPGADPVLRYPYGRYQPTLGNVDPNSLANPFLKTAPPPTPPPAFRPPPR